MAAAGEDAQTDGQFLHHVEDRHQDQLQDEQPVAPLHAALARGDHAADIGIGQHHHEPRAEHGQRAGQAFRPGDFTRGISPRGISLGAFRPGAFCSWALRRGSTHLASVHRLLIVPRQVPALPDVASCSQLAGGDNLLVAGLSTKP